MKWKYLGLHIALATVVAWMLLSAYAILVGPASIMRNDVFLLVIVLFGGLLQAVTSLGTWLWNRHE